MSFIPSQSGNYFDLRAPAGVNSGCDVVFDFNQFTSRQTVRLFGALEIATVATGARFGLAGAGTTTTQLNKPTAAANWTASNLIGKYLRIVAGGGAPTDGSEVLRPILANTTTGISVNVVPGMDATTRFQIVSLASQIDRISAAVNIAIRITACNVPVEIYGLDFTNVNNLESLISVSDSANVYIEGCNVNFNTSNPAYYIRRTNQVTVAHCFQTNSGDMEISQCFNVEVTGNNSIAGGVVTVQDCLAVAVTKHTALSSPSRVVGVIRCNYAQIEVTANSSLATPIYIESCNTVDTVGTLLVGTNPGATYGLEIARAGNVSLVGSTISGAADVLFQGYAITWALLSSPAYGVVQKYAGSAVATVGQAKAIVDGNYSYLGDVNVGGRFLPFGYVNFAANTAPFVLVSTDSLNMGNGQVNGAPATTEAPRSCLDVVNNSATTVAILPDGAAIAGTFGFILNHGSQPLPLQAPPGGAIIGATSAPINKVTMFFSTNATSGTTFFVSVLP